MASAWAGAVTAALRCRFQPAGIVAGAAALSALGAAGSGSRKQPAVVSFEEERRPAYEPPPRWGRSFASIPKAMPKDHAGQLAWAVKHLEVGTLRNVLSKWPHGAELIDSDDNTLFHLAASEPSLYAANPAAAQEVLELLFQEGWGVVDMKNQQGERAELVARQLDKSGHAAKLLEGRSRDFVEKSRADKPLRLIGERSPVPWKWDYPVQDERRRSWAGCLKNPFPQETVDAWMKETAANGTWCKMPGVPRRVAWYVSEDCADCPYRYSGLEYPATVFPPFMLKIREAVCERCGLAPEEYPNCCNVNLYADQDNEVGWHSDDEVMFQGLAGDTCIISLSVGVPREFCWRLQGTTDCVGSVALGNGDIMTMEGLFQKHYKHAVPKTEQKSGARINYTFRWIRVKAHAVDAGTLATAPSK